MLDGRLSNEITSIPSSLKDSQRRGVRGGVHNFFLKGPRGQGGLLIWTSMGPMNQKGGFLYGLACVQWTHMSYPNEFQISYIQYLYWIRALSSPPIELVPNIFSRQFCALHVGRYRLRHFHVHQTHSNLGFSFLMQLSQQSNSSQRWEQFF